MDAVAVAVVLGAVLALPFIGARWSFVASLVIAGAVIVYGGASVVLNLVNYATNSDLGIAFGLVFIAVGTVIGALAWVLRRRAVRKRQKPWS